MGDYDSIDVVIESEDTSCKQERLRDIEEQSRGNIFDFEHLIRDQHDATKNEEHCTHILDFLVWLHKPKWLPPHPANIAVMI